MYILAFNSKNIIRMYLSALLIILVDYRLVRGSSTINNDDYDYPNPTFLNVPAKSAAAYFDPSFTRNITTVVGQSAFLNCRVLNLDNKTVSWVRHKDINLLTVGKYTYSADERFVPLNDEKTGEWTLQIKYAQKKDTGAYECQISTTPPKGVIVYLVVVEPNTTILGGPDLYINVGSTINLTCVLQQSPVPPESIQWTHNNQEINYDSPRGGVSVITEKGETTTSYLLIQRASPTDSGKYSCIPSNANTVTVNVHILKGEHPAAMHHSGENKQNNVYCKCDLLILLSTILSIFVCKFYNE